MDYPVDHAPTHRRAGESLESTANVPGAVAVAVALTALSFGLFELAAGGAGIAAVAVILAVVFGAAGLGWQIHAHEAELHLAATGSNTPTRPLSK